MNLLIDNRTDEPLTAELEDAIRRAAAEALRYEEFDEDCEISVSIVDNEEIREINRQFRSIDRATDVLSFPMLTFAEGEEAEVNENDEIVLGDIIISLERAKEQAEEYGQYAASFRLRPHGAGGGSGDVPPPEGNFVAGRFPKRMREKVTLRAKLSLHRKNSFNRPCIEKTFQNRDAG